MPPHIQQQQQPPVQQRPPMHSAGGPPSNRWGAPVDRRPPPREEQPRDPRAAIQERHRQMAPRPSPQTRREGVFSLFIIFYSLLSLLVERRSSPRRVSPQQVTSPARKREAPPPKREPPPPKRERERSPLREREPREVRSSPAPSKREVDSPPRRRQRIIPRYSFYQPRPLTTE